jgi:ArsR family transcriptional regulator, arsenate/arsenite/antimonite-responsive transcriptional repressor
MEYLELVAPVGAGCCAPLMAAPLVAEHATDLARVFKALGDPVRLRLLPLITSAGDEVRVCDLTGAFDLTAPTISHHLKVLREAGLVDCERRGTWVYAGPPAAGGRQLLALPRASVPFRTGGRRHSGRAMGLGRPGLMACSSAAETGGIGAALSRVPTWGSASQTTGERWLPSVVKTP